MKIFARNWRKVKNIFRINIFFFLDCFLIVCLSGMPEGGIHRQITQIWRNSVTTWRWKVLAVPMAVKHFFGGETSKVGGIEKICFKNWSISVFQGKIYHFNHFFSEETENCLWNCDFERRSLTLFLTHSDGSNWHKVLESCFNRISNTFLPLLA